MGRASSKMPPLRVLQVDPSAYTPPYDHALCTALAEAGAQVTLATSRFGYGEVPARAGRAGPLGPRGGAGARRLRPRRARVLRAAAGRGRLARPPRRQARPA